MTVGAKQLDNGIGSTLVLLWESQERTPSSRPALLAEAIRRGGEPLTSVGVRRTRLHFLGTFAKHPFAHIGRALEELNAGLLAVD